MRYTKLSATGYEYSAAFYQKEFEDILRGIIVCCRNICSSDISLPNNENEIRNIIIRDYLKIEDFKRAHFNLSKYHFDYETVENYGRADIRILPVNPYLNDHAYYVIECKRLDRRNLKGATGLNAEYVKNGICRFVTGYYSSYFKINGMIGFFVESMLFEENINNLNTLLSENLINDKGDTVNASHLQEITPTNIIPDFNFSYISTHRINDQDNLILYHLMIDFSKNIQ